MRPTAIIFVISLAACGRHGFADIDASPAIDGEPEPDAMVDADTRLPGLLASYRMDDDPSDGVIDDSGGSARIARCVGGISCPTSVPGKHGQAFAFDGTNQYARITYDTWLATPNAFSIAAWIYLDTQIDQVAFAKAYGTGVDDSWGITAWSPIATTGTCLETVNSALARECVCGPTLPAGQWIHVAARWTGATKALFLDGVKVGELTNAPSSVVDTHDVMIGGDENGGSPAYLFHGKLDELQIYDRGLTDDEIRSLVQ